MSALVNGTTIDTFIWNADAGSAFADRTSLAEHAITNVSLSAGDVIELVGFKDGSEPLRTDYIDFVYVDELIG